MKPNHEIVLLSLKNWLDSLIISTCVELEENKDYFYLDTDDKNNMDSLEHLKERLNSSVNNSFYNQDFPQIIENVTRFIKPAGIVSASAASPSKCLKAAVLAVRLGYIFLPLDKEGKYFDGIIDRFSAEELCSLPVIYLGKEEDLAQYSNIKIIEKPLYLTDDKAIFSYMKKIGLPVDYLVLVNSYDLFKEAEPVSCLGDMWVKGTCLLSPLLASYRNIFLYDVNSQTPKSEEIENDINMFLKETGFKPKYFAIMASPGAIPFIYSDIKTIGSEAEELTRDIHLQLNNDLFFDVAEGRLFQSTIAGLSLQILSSKYYHLISNIQKQKNILIATTPYVETGIIFNSDDALIEAYLKPLLEETGNKVTVLAQKDTSFHNVANYLKEADFFLYTGHGGPETLNTHERYLTRVDLKILPPLIAYASACSTLNSRPYWLSVNDGHDWEAIAIKPENVIGLSMVEKGAVCFVGGATSEDLQYTTSVYSVFMEALLLNGMSVGEALNETRNIVSLYSLTLNQKAIEEYRIYKDGTANFIHQQILLGDPALVPYPKVSETDNILTSINDKVTEQEIDININPFSWKSTKAVINHTGPSRKYYGCNSIEVITPVARNLIPWGDFYKVAPCSDEVSDLAIMSNFLRVEVNIPSGMAPLYLELVHAEANGECAICRTKHELKKTALEYYSCFKIPYLMLPPVELNMKNGWPFLTEISDKSQKLHFLVPLLVIDDHTKMLVKAEKLKFKLKLAKGKELNGIIKSTASENNYFLVKALSSEDNFPYSLALGLVKKSEEFKLYCAKDTEKITVEDQYPLYDLLEKYSPFKHEYWNIDFGGKNEIYLQNTKLANINGSIIDVEDATPIAGALIRIWRGKLDPNGYELIEGYVGESYSNDTGKFTFPLKPGNYLISIAAKKENRLYKSKQFEVIIEDLCDKFMLFPLDAAVVIKGKILFKGNPPPYVSVKIRKFPKKEAVETLNTAPVRKDGSYGCVVGFQDRFSIDIELEGWKAIEDNNNNRGYKLLPGEQLIKNYTVFPCREGAS